MAKTFNLISAATVTATEIEQALRDGRLYIQPVAQSVDWIRTEVNNIIARIAHYAAADNVVEQVWNALLSNEERVETFRLSHYDKAGSINCYRIAAVVHYMYQIGLYNMQKCKSAKVPCSFSSLCRELFGEEDADLYRRNCYPYARWEDECIIRKYSVL